MECIIHCIIPMFRKESSSCGLEVMSRWRTMVWCFWHWVHFLSIVPYLVIWILQVAILKDWIRMFTQPPMTALWLAKLPYSLCKVHSRVCGLWTAKLVHFGYYEARCLLSVRPLTEPTVLNGRLHEKKLSEQTVSALKMT